jgi:hypothetical protein
MSGETGQGFIKVPGQYAAATMKKEFLLKE